VRRRWRRIDAAIDCEPGLWEAWHVHPLSNEDGIMSELVAIAYDDLDTAQRVATNLGGAMKDLSSS
jgi:hypothetical protein